MDKQKPDDSLPFIDALANKHRLEIYCMLLQRGSICYKDLEGKTELSQPTLSHHLSKLLRAKVIIAERKKREYSYSLNSAECLRNLHLLMPAGVKHKSAARHRAKGSEKKKQSHPLWKFLFE